MTPHSQRRQWDRRNILTRKEMLEEGHAQGVTTHAIRCIKGSDIRLISLISGCCIRSKHAVFSYFSKDFYPLTTVHWYLANILIYSADIFQYSPEICQIFVWNSANFILISVYYTSDIRLVSLGYQPDPYTWYYPDIGSNTWYYPDIQCTDFQQGLTPWPSYALTYAGIFWLRSQRPANWSGKGK